MKKLVNKIKPYLPIALLVIILVIAVLVIVFKNPSSVISNSNSVVNQKIINTKTGPVFDSNKYKKLARDLFARLSPDDPSLAQEVKKELLDVTVSKEFKEVHFELVMASASLEDYSLSRDEKSLDKAKIILAKLKKDYSWLTDKSL